MSRVDRVSRPRRDVSSARKARRASRTASVLAEATVPASTAAERYLADPSPSREPVIVEAP